MQGIYNYRPDTSHASRVHNFAAVLYLQSVLHVMLFRPWSNFIIIITIIIIIIEFISKKKGSWTAQQWTSGS
jgi:hypothetical protein